MTITDATTDAMLAAVVADPRNDLPRLAFADRMDDIGQHVWAEFIRVQIELAKWDNGWPPKPYERKDALRQREWALWRDRAVTMFPDIAYRSWSVPSEMVFQPSGHDCKGIVRRGFVTEVRMSLADFMGGECGRCGGSGMSEREYHGAVVIDGGCPRCNGTGRTPGAVAALARHPIERVVLTDLDPEWNDTNPGWVDESSMRGRGAVDDFDIIPATIYKHLAGGIARDSQLRWREYPTVADARADLSGAAVAIIQEHRERK
jgi:uncharacterized protein (TIGR02996 family)